MDKTEYILTRSKRKDKKLALHIIPEKGREKTINFGAKGMSDYTIHKNAERKERYIERHKKEQERGFWQNDKQNIQKPSYLSRYVLWEHPNIQSAVNEVQKNLKIKIKNNI